MTCKNKGYQTDRPTKGPKVKKTKLKTETGRAGKKAGSAKRKRIGE